MEKLLGLFTSKPMEIIEKENFFKKTFRLVFLLATAIIAAYGIYSIISVAIDYFDVVFNMDAFPIIRHLILFVLCLIIAVATYLFIVGAMYNRAKLILSGPETNLVDIMPGVFKTIGVIGAIIPLAIGLITLFSTALVAMPFFPMDGLVGIVSSFSFVDIPGTFSGLGVDTFKEYFSQLFQVGFFVMILSIFVSFANLVGMYLLSAIYKLVVDFLRK
ncbi:MAG: hypothetical protein PHW82_15470 [Bacteroidales bacterium]|nr:hypothetical protein [Bacteroidales bacterium]